MNDHSVIIAGAGPVGLTAALALSRAGVKGLVLESADGIDKRMRASTFHPPTLDMLKTLGAADTLIQSGLVTRVWQMRQHETGRHVDFDLGLISDVTEHPFRLQCEQHRLCEILADALVADGNFEVRFSCGLTDFVADDADAIVVTSSAGDEIRCDWLIGADGAGSRVREVLALDYSGRTYEHASVLVTTDFPFHEYIEGLANVAYCWSTAGPFSLLRLPGRWRASLYPGVGGDLDTLQKPEHIRPALARIHPEAADAQILGINPYRVHERCVPRFRAGRVLLAGDAAHLNAPSGGMGMNGGIHDALNLTGKLLRVMAGEPEDLLDCYSRQRQYMASAAIIPQAADNRARMHTTDAGEQERRLRHFEEIRRDENRCREFLLRSSMITGLREAAVIP